MSASVMMLVGRAGCPAPSERSRPASSDRRPQRRGPLCSTVVSGCRITVRGGRLARWSARHSLHLDPSPFTFRWGSVAGARRGQEMFAASGFRLTLFAHLADPATGAEPLRQPDLSPDVHKFSPGSGYWLDPAARTRSSGTAKVAFQPCADRVVQHRVERRTVPRVPRTMADAPVIRAPGGLAFAARAVHDTQPMTSQPLLRRPVGGNRWRSASRVWRSRSRRFSARLIPRRGRAAPAESRRRLDMADAGRPGGIVRGVAPRPAVPAGIPQL